MQIMYVCTGNQCRSVMAEYYTRAKLADRGIGLQSGNITVRSAGTLHYPPHPADPMVIDLLKDDGIDANSHSSTPLTTDISRQADLILGFEREQISDLLEQNPLAIRKVFLFNDFVNACKHMHAEGPIAGDTADSDMTGMALTALAPYYVPETETEDGHRQSREVFERVYVEIKHGVDIMLGAVA